MRLRIGVLDDDPDCREILLWFLEPHYEVETFATIEQLESALAFTKFDLILVDVVINQQNRGPEVLASVHTLPPGKRPPVVLVNAEGARLKEDAVLAAGFSGFSVKPFQFEAMSGLIQRLLSTRRRQSAVA